MLQDLPPLDLPEHGFVDAWYARAGVRSGQRRYDAPDPEVDKLFFPDQLIPHANHEAVLGLDPQRRRYLNAQHLFQWLNFTTHFEVAVVNRATQRIAEGNSGLSVPDHTRMGAFQIYIDEGYHSLYNLDVRRQLEARHNIAALPYDFTPFLHELDGVGAHLPGLNRLVQLLQVVVFETLITSILIDIPQDPRVMTLVRETVREHAIDEGRHHAFFSAFFRELWTQLAPSTRVTVAHFLPEMILKSLRPNIETVQAALRTVGLSEAVVRAVLADSYSAAATNAYIRTASAKTVHLFEECGVLDIPGARENFIAAGLEPIPDSRD